MKTKQTNLKRIKANLERLYFKSFESEQALQAYILACEKYNRDKPFKKPLKR